MGAVGGWAVSSSPHPSSFTQKLLGMCAHPVGTLPGRVCQAPQATEEEALVQRGMVTEGGWEQESASVGTRKEVLCEKRVAQASDPVLLLRSCSAVRSWRTWQGCGQSAGSWGTQILPAVLPTWVKSSQSLSWLPTQGPSVCPSH